MESSRNTAGVVRERLDFSTILRCVATNFAVFSARARRRGSGSFWLSPHTHIDRAAEPERDVEFGACLSALPLLLLPIVTHAYPRHTAYGRLAPPHPVAAAHPRTQSLGQLFTPPFCRRRHHLHHRLDSPTLARYRRQLSHRLSARQTIHTRAQLPCSSVRIIRSRSLPDFATQLSSVLSHPRSTRTASNQSCDSCCGRSPILTGRSRPRRKSDPCLLQQSTWLL
ncbi:hypothetical protein PHSY_006436 [Pseudozyma hubeiensis SY62]|uniref:Uncharacterized protein n=1 Tax=Pseudozyma hubeiensis (strain SY62) TaxID=1305764 RepID=R9PBV6_PSEHS|nr:hypothetical protein PHSY_006436 [Pseudozyma hubeiensis SY62]GAC98841.1 hypothetical protein PHSY_006436 [Pseudozyma hubeiensis SY62]